MRVSLAICTYNRAAMLDRTLSRVAELSVPVGVELEVHVVNNKSTDKTEKILMKWENRKIINVLFEDIQGLSYARNRAVKASAGELLPWTDDDVLIDTDWLTNYVEAARIYPNASFLGGPVAPHFDMRPPKWVTNHLTHLSGPFSLMDYQLDDAMALMPLGWHPFGANMAFRTDVLRAYPFNESLGRAGGLLVGGEDTELFGRLTAAGHRGVWVGKARVFHAIPSDRCTLRFVWAWYDGAGRTAARGIQPEKTPIEAVKSLAGTRASGGLDGKAEQALWWKSFFGGPMWLRAIKAIAYFRGFHAERLDIQRRKRLTRRLA